ncbi:MAG: DUF4011 domain-containing protein [Serratia rubidaea]|nr:DUF4011 domain-containing protein [Serratia rubidaea]
MLPSFELDIEVEGTKEATGQLVHWQRKLLDLTTRNRLLHLPDSAKSIRLICSNPGLPGRQKLAEGKQKIHIVPLPDLEMGGRDAELYRQQTNGDLEKEYAQRALERGEVVSPLEKNRLESSLIDCIANLKATWKKRRQYALFLAIGFLKWKKSADDQEVMWLLLSFCRFNPI